MTLEMLTLSDQCANGYIVSVMLLRRERGARDDASIVGADRAFS